MVTEFIERSKIMLNNEQETMSNEQLELGTGGWGLVARERSLKAMKVNSSSDSYESSQNISISPLLFAPQSLLKPRSLFFLLASLLWSACYFLFVSCSLFNAPLQDDYFGKIDEEIAWANAPRLTVNVAFPPEWGISTQLGENRCFDVKRTGETPRAGYPFNVDFTPNSGYWFVEWLAFEFTENFRLESITGLEFDAAKNLSLKADVEIPAAAETLTGAFATNITITTDKKVTLVPFCSERPRITQSNPPLNNSGFSYTRGQEIRIWIDLGYEQDTEIEFDEGLIEIYGQNISDGSPWNGSGELSAYYEKPVYEASSKSIIIKPNSTLPQEDNYPPGNCTITVTVGTGIKAANGKEMAAPLSFSYRTSS